VTKPNIGLLEIYVNENGIDSIGVRSTTMDLGNGARGTQSMTIDSGAMLAWLRDHGMNELADLLLKMQREGRACL